MESPLRTLAERVGFEPTAQLGSSLKKACSITAPLAPLRFVDIHPGFVLNRSRPLAVGEARVVELLLQGN
jgi:hypothetical protein